MDLNDLLKLYRKDFDDGILKITQEYDRVVNENMKLRQENINLKDECYKDNEIARLDKKIRQININNDFILNKAMAKKRDEFVETHCKNCESYNKSWTYSYDYTRTAIDDMVYIRCSCGEECYLGCV